MRLQELDCPRCHRHIIVDADEHIARCDYCGTPVLLDGAPLPYTPDPGPRTESRLRGRYTGATDVYAPQSEKNWWVAFLLCLFLGTVGVHRFYTGKVGSGVLYVLTGGLFGIGWLVDLVRLLLGTFTDSASLPLRRPF